MKRSDVFDSTEAQNGLKSYWMNMIIRFYTHLWSSIAAVIKTKGGWNKL